MITFLELVHHGQSFNFDGATMFDAGGRSAQTWPLDMFPRCLTVVVCRPLELRSGHLTSGSAVEQNNSQYSVASKSVRHGGKAGQAAVAVFYNIYIDFSVLCCIFLLDYYTCINMIRVHLSTIDIGVRSGIPHTR